MRRNHDRVYIFVGWYAVQDKYKIPPQCRTPVNETLRGITYAVALKHSPCSRRDLMKLEGQHVRRGDNEGLCPAPGMRYLPCV